MKLTPYQKSHIEALVAFHRKPPTAWGVLTHRPKLLLPWAFIIAASVASYFLVDQRFGLFLLGMSFGSVLRVIAHCRFAVLAWPVTEQIIDWEKVEALHRQSECS